MNKWNFMLLATTLVLTILIDNAESLRIFSPEDFLSQYNLTNIPKSKYIFLVAGIFLTISGALACCIITMKKLNK